MPQIPQQILSHTHGGYKVSGYEQGIYLCLRAQFWIQTIISTKWGLDYANHAERPKQWQLCLTSSSDKGKTWHYYILENIGLLENQALPTVWWDIEGRGHNLVRILLEVTK